MLKFDILENQLGPKRPIKLEYAQYTVLMTERFSEVLAKAIDKSSLRKQWLGCNSYMWSGLRSCIYTQGPAS